MENVVCKWNFFCSVGFFGFWFGLAFFLLDFKEAEVWRLQLWDWVPCTVGQVTLDMWLIFWACQLWCWTLRLVQTTGKAQRINKNEFVEMRGEDGVYPQLSLNCSHKCQQSCIRNQQRVLKHFRVHHWINFIKQTRIFILTLLFIFRKMFLNA